MPQTNYTPILIYASSTTGNTPSAGNLTNSSGGAELAINYFDGRLFYKDASNVVQVLATRGTAAIGGSTTQVQYNNAGVLAGSANLTFDGTILTANTLTVTNTATAAKFSPTGNVVTGNGMYLPAANTLAWSVNGAEALRLNATSLLIGTTTNTNSSALVANGTISETVSSVQYLVASQYDIGTEPNDIPVNGFLGSMAYQDASYVSVVQINAGTVSATTLLEQGRPVVTNADIGTGANQIPLNQYLGAMAYQDSISTLLGAGGGITLGTGTICKGTFVNSDGVKRAIIILDLTGLTDGGTAGDIIGSTSTSIDATKQPAFIAQLPVAFTVLGGRMTCLEAPAGGGTDIDLYSATEGTGVQDSAISALTETQIVNGGVQALGTVSYFIADPAAQSYLYMVSQGTGAATYTAGRFLIEIFGV